jgi:hypothetical protein
LNIRKREQYVKKRRPSMITDSNQARLAKMTGRRVQEVIFRKDDEDFTYKGRRAANVTG